MSAEMKSRKLKEQNIDRALEWVGSAVHPVISGGERGSMCIPYGRIAPMSGTALIAIHTEDGFVIAADGRRRKGNLLENDKTQKIFPIVRHPDYLAYALAGATQLPKREKPNSVLYDMHKTIRASIDSLQQKHPVNFELFVDLIAKRITKSLAKLVKNEPGVKFPPDDQGTILHLLIAGFYDQMPAMAKVRIFHRHERIAKTPDVEAYRPIGTRWNISMPARLGEMLLSGQDDRLANYYTPSLKKLKNKESMSLSEAQDAATALINACSDPIAVQIDPTANTVGGHLHIARITESNGFNWVIPPIE